MKKSAALFLLTLFFTALASSADQLYSVQTELKNRGFFYGDVNGQASPETTAALRRYQIRHGLEVTGAVNQETLGSLGMGPAKPAPQAEPTPAPRPAPVLRNAAPAPAPPVRPRNDEPAAPVEESDRAFLQREEIQRRAAAAAASLPPEPRDPSVLRPPTPLDAPGDDYPVIFAQTPYANAPREVQQRTLRNAQATLASRGFYRDIIDGLPGPATEEALLTFQRAARLTLTGRLDLETLSALRLLPVRTVIRAPDPATRRVYRGILVD